MKDMIIAQLKEKVGLSEEVAEKAAKVVLDLFENNQDKFADLAKGKLGDSRSGAHGGMLAGKD